MQRVENNIKKIAEFITSLNMTDKQRAYLIKIFNETSKELNHIKIRFESATGNKIHEYDLMMGKVVNLLQIMGFTKLDLESNLFHDKFIKFIVMNNHEFTRKPTYRDLNNIRIMYEMYVIENDEEPETLKDLKNVQND